MQAVGTSNIKIYHTINCCMFNVSIFTLAINKNVVLDAISNSEQEFSSKGTVHHAFACVILI